MIVVGVVLLVLGLIAAIGVFAGGTAVFTLAVGSITWATNSAQVFLTGAAVMLVLVAGARVTWIGWKRLHRQKKDVRSLRRSAEAAGVTTASGTDGGQEQPALDAAAATPDKDGAETPSPSGDNTAEPSQESVHRPDPGDEIRTRPLDREHRGDTER
jgi:hypothetical protein